MTPSTFDPIDLSIGLLKRIVVKVVHLQEFKPSKTKAEKGEIETVVCEFRKFVETAVDREGKSQFTILEIK